jgi:hypothetical protein
MKYNWQELIKETLPDAVAVEDKINEKQLRANARALLLDILENHYDKYYLTEGKDAYTSKKDFFKAGFEAGVRAALTFHVEQNSLLMDELKKI